jgi:hypothetical protein
MWLPVSAIWRHGMVGSVAVRSSGIWREASLMISTKRSKAALTKPILIERRF